MSNIDKRALREAAANAKIAGEAPVMPFDQRITALNDFMKHCTPETVLALLDELEAKDRRIAELAAELSAVDAIHNEAVFITDEHYEQCPPEVQKMIRALAVLQIPAYQAFLAEVRAQGVEKFAELPAVKMVCLSHLAKWFAEKLRQEAAK